MLGVTEEEDTFDGVKGRASELLKSVGGSGRTLRITLEDEAVIRVTLKGGSDSIDDIPRALGGDLTEAGPIIGVVDLTARLLRGDSSIHRSESGRFALRFTCSSGVDEGVSRAAVGLASSPGAPISISRTAGLSLFDDGSGDRKEREQRKDSKESEHLEDVEEKRCRRSRKR